MRAVSGIVPQPDVVARTAGVVLAAGSGSRFGLPKQFERLGGCRLVDRAIDLIAPWCSTVVVVVPAGHHWTGADFVTAVTGSDSRVGSVARGLEAVPSHHDVVIVHDSVRPLATPSVVGSVVAAVLAGADGALPVWETPDTIKRVVDGRLEHLGREGMGIAQSPFAFRASALRSAIAGVGAAYVEETLAVQAEGGRVVAVAGDRWSIHIVEPRDLVLADRLLDAMDLPRSDAQSPSKVRH